MRRLGSRRRTGHEPGTSRARRGEAGDKAVSPPGRRYRGLIAALPCTVCGRPRRHAAPVRRPYDSHTARAQAGASKERNRQPPTYSCRCGYSHDYSYGDGAAREDMRSVTMRDARCAGSGREAGTRPRIRGFKRCGLRTYSDRQTTTGSARTAEPVEQMPGTRYGELGSRQPGRRACPRARSLETRTADRRQAGLRTQS